MSVKMGQLATPTVINEAIDDLQPAGLTQLSNAWQAEISAFVHASLPLLPISNIRRYTVVVSRQNFKSVAAPSQDRSLRKEENGRE